MIFKGVVDIFKNLRNSDRDYFINKPIRWLSLFVIFTAFYPVYIYLFVHLYLNKNLDEYVLILLTGTYMALPFLSFGSILRTLDKFLNIDKYFPPDRENKIYDINKRTEAILAYVKAKPANYIFMHILIEIPVTLIFIYITFIFIFSPIHMNVIIRLALGGFCFGICYASLSLLIGFLMYPIIKPCELFEDIRQASKELWENKKLIWISLCLISAIFFVFFFEKSELYRCSIDFPLIPEMTRIYFIMLGLGLSPVFSYLILFMAKTEKFKPETENIFTLTVNYTILFLPCLYIIFILLGHLSITKLLLIIVFALGTSYTILSGILIFSVNKLTKIFKNQEKSHIILIIFMILSISLIYTSEHFKLYKYPADLYFSKINENKITSDRTKSVELADYVITGNSANRLIEFHYYIPAKVLQNKSKQAPLIIVPSYTYEKENIKFQQPIKDFADKEGCVLVTTYFMDNLNDIIFNSGFDKPSVWSGKALLDMVEKVKQKGYSLSKFYMLGAHSGADFSLRFALWKPEYCIANATYSNYNSIAINTANPVKYFVTASSGEAKYMKENVLEFYGKAKKLGMNIKYKEYSDYYNDKNLEERLNFFKQIIDKKQEK